MASGGDESDGDVIRTGKKGNNLPVWGNERSMNLNSLILTNIQSSQYFKVNLFELKTYHEVVDEIYYKVSHLEPWEKGSRKTFGQTGMCGGVRGVGAGGIVSTAYCLLYKLFTLKLTRKQLTGLINHCDSPYIRGLGFMYIRYTQPPADLWDWYEPYFEDEEEIDVKAGGGQNITVGDMVKQFLSKLDWFDTLFPRIPVPIQMSVEKKLKEKYPHMSVRAPGPKHVDKTLGEAPRTPSRRRSPENGRRRTSGSRERKHERPTSREGRGDSRRSRSPRRRNSPLRKDRRRSRSRERDYRGGDVSQRGYGHRGYEGNRRHESYEEMLAKERQRQQRSGDRHRDRSRERRY
ncbi:pre-mRNA-splicing factor 38B-like [Artemia franciscana]|uniref:Pre-mRNA-splicing factor 38 n=1 Tax=Artemia franciscana TaxID=6661 RepID=A0AA88HB42_ARTSF|nr:hypothetical protein QYM36_017753 [Artemia franciscana]